ncbi:MAG: thioredoxin [Lachnospiraceae bacterium]|nr:thioredoxin [Lachnospiraceae bacterium]
MERTFTSANFESEVLSSTVPVLVDFYADWCGPCKMMAPAVEQLAQELEGKAVVGKLNVDDNEDIAVKYQVMSIPTLIVFKDGQAVKKSVGLQSKDDVRKMVESV